MWYEDERVAMTRRRASEQYRRLQNQALRVRLWSTLTGRQRNLLNLTEIQNEIQVHHRRAVGLQLVPIAQIQGSEGRSEDFDVDFRPLKGYNKERWVDIAVARSVDKPLPPVELVQINDLYFVRDGHHRVSVAKVDGQLEIEAQVTVWQGTPAPAQSTTAFNDSFHG